MIVTWVRDGAERCASYVEIRRAELAGEPLALRVLCAGRHYLIATAASIAGPPVALVPLVRGERATWCATVAEAIHILEAAAAVTH